jgi:hypothetical protein
MGEQSWCFLDNTRNFMSAASGVLRPTRVRRDIGALWIYFSTSEIDDVMLLSRRGCFNSDFSMDEVLNHFDERRTDARKKSQ